MNAEHFIERLETYRSPEQLEKHQHLKSDESDELLGVRMGQVFALAKEFIEMPPEEIEKLLESPIHEVRVGAVSISLARQPRLAGNGFTQLLIID
jgi:hypothetical protein